MGDRNIRQDFVSRKRLIFATWRKTVKLEKAFILCVVNVCSKSLANKGFKHINEASRGNHANAMKLKLMSLAL